MILHAGRWRAACALPRDKQAPDTVVGEHPGPGAQPALRIDHDARRLRPGDPAHGQLRVVGDGGADADDDSVHQRP